jgi:outer membrane protein OmpA-like peptidoglycan-associated protein
LANAEAGVANHKNKKMVNSMAREAIQTAEDARILTVKRTADSSVNQRLSMADDAVRSAQDARDMANTDAMIAKADAAKAKAAADRAESEKGKLREELRAQLNAVLETRDTARGLIVNMSDVLFATGKYDLKPPVREKLAKVAGIVLGHPGLKLQVEGHTDNVGSDQFNQNLSEKRAQSVRDYLVQQGLGANDVTAVGYGKTKPIASNDNATGRAQNRRVEIVVTGELIGAMSSTK